MSFLTVSISTTGPCPCSCLWDVRVIFRPPCSCHGNSKSCCVAQTAESSLVDSLLTAISRRQQVGCESFSPASVSSKTALMPRKYCFPAEITSNMYVQGNRFSSSASRCHEELLPSFQMTICGTKSCEGLPSRCATGRHLFLCMTSSAV